MATCTSSRAARAATLCSVRDTVPSSRRRGSFPSMIGVLMVMVLLLDDPSVTQESVGQWLPPSTVEAQHRARLQASPQAQAEVGHHDGQRPDVAESGVRVVGWAVERLARMRVDTGD